VFDANNVSEFHYYINVGMTPLKQIRGTQAKGFRMTVLLAHRIVVC